MTKQQNLNDQASFSAPIEDLQVRIAFLDDLVESGNCRSEKANEPVISTC